MAVSRVGVIGAGLMGRGITEVAARAGLKVLLDDLSDDLCRRGVEFVSNDLDRMIKRGRVKPEERERALANIETTTRLEDFHDVDFVIEAVVENEPDKIEVFQKLDKICRPEVIFASNTSSISITRMGARTSRAPRFIGMHFMNPVPVMRLIEIIRGLATSQETFEQTKALAERLGKSTLAAEDYPGFIVNRILLPMINEAIYTLYEGVGGIEDIDTAMKLGTNQPMGPLELADLVGLDTSLAILEVMHRTFGDDKYRPCPLLKKYVDAGYLGRKVGRGFYVYNEQGMGVPPAAR
jgi:3-hydroxybutyryl-CoA dehydrogenase